MAKILYPYAPDVEGRRRSTRELESPRPLSCGDCDNDVIARRERVRRSMWSVRSKRRAAGRNPYLLAEATTMRARHRDRHAPHLATTHMMG